jgi:hypothetical protein
MKWFACSLDDENRGLRRDRWLELGSWDLIEFHTTDRGLRLVFAAKPGVERELLELTELERDCCAFVSWTVTSPNSRVILEIAGEDDDAVPAAQGMFNLLQVLLTPAA